jgi:hypothetical protein
MSQTARRITIGIIVVLLILMAVLLLRGPRFSVSGTQTYDSTSKPLTIPDMQVRCGSVLTVGWPSDHAFLNDSPHGWMSFHVEPSLSLPSDRFDAIMSGFDQECNERRDTYIAFLIVLVIPVCLLGTLVITRRPVPTEPGPVATEVSAA